MIFKKFWKKDKSAERKSKFGEGSYMHLRANVKPRSRFKRLPNFNFKGFGFSKLKRVFNFKLLFLVLIIILIGACYYIALRTNVFTIKKVVIESNIKVENEAEIKQEFVGKNIFRVNNSVAFEFLNSKNPRVRNVLVRRVYPNAIQIKMIVDVPKHLALNFNGAALLNNDFEVLDKFESKEILTLLQYEKDLLAGIGNEESIFVAEAYRKNLSEEEKKVFEWENVPKEDKKEVLNQIKKDLQKKVDKYFDSLHKDLKAKIPEYDQLQIVDFYDERTLDTNRQRESQLEINNRVTEVIEKNKQKIVYQRWVSRLNLVVRTDRKITLNFSTANVLVDVDTQFRSLEALISEGKFKEGSHFDLRTKNFVAE